MVKFRTPIGARIRRKRIAAGLSQVALARTLGISASYLNLIENNKRSIGGTLLLRIGERLGIDLEHLSGESEARTIAAIGDLMAEPLMRGIEIEPQAVRDLVARFPEAGTALARLHRAYADATMEIEVLRQRLKSDPLLSQILHEILNRIAGIKSGAEILADIPDITEDERRRFITTINTEARELVPTTQSLLAYFDQTSARQRPVSPVMEVDEALITHNNHFPELETIAGILRGELAGRGPIEERQLAAALERRFGISCRIGNAAAASANAPALVFSETMPRPARIFRMLRAYALKASAASLAQTTERLELSTEEARGLALRALSSYVAGAIMMPYDDFLRMAEENRYDVELLSGLAGVSFEQAAHRLVTLRARGREGLPFGFLRTDRSGRLTKRFPLPGLTIPGFGHGCPLWPIYDAFATGGVVRQVSVFPGGGRFLLVAKTVSKHATRFGQKPLTFSIMLGCDVVHADRTVYGDGLDLSAAPVEVGPSCAPCPRLSCAHRQEIPL
ncbi:putative transcriptional regulator/transcriptional regulator with XRE-family HTH domain [Mycoplana sp. BE70]|uniref:helix-turn-helix domain-containing protein n=1 Tax=Mycoplana sp. BE70 TaxID=2817775 RepID=UPI00285D368E|nr:short-chain fatty acyl-CoA regulator family protein [Mycoplana sp. BE70]MDR6756549.1 putative transcriptional regulator/transcriptional regulator with XRE-family HTH domain [Mycoplana sp. BE70]